MLLCRQEHFLHISQQFSRLFSTSLNTPLFLNQPSFSQPTPFFSTSPVFSQPAPLFLNHPPSFCSATPLSLILPSSLPCQPIPPKNTLKQGARPLNSGGEPAPLKLGGGMVLQGFFLTKLVVFGVRVLQLFYLGRQRSWLCGI